MSGNLWQKTIDSIADSSLGRIHVHLSRKWIEPDPIKQASKIYTQLGLDQQEYRNVLLYFNTRHHRFSLVTTSTVINQFGQPYWKQLSLQLEEDLHCTRFEKAVQLTLETLGISLKKHFPQN